jgi:hypothetical protein
VLSLPTRSACSLYRSSVRTGNFDRNPRVGHARSPYDRPRPLDTGRNDAAACDCSASKATISIVSRAKLATSRRRKPTTVAVPNAVEADNDIEESAGGLGIERRRFPFLVGVSEPTRGGGGFIFPRSGLMMSQLKYMRTVTRCSLPPDNSTKGSHRKSLCCNIPS